MEVAVTPLSIGEGLGVRSVQKKVVKW